MNFGSYILMCYFLYSSGRCVPKLKYLEAEAKTSQHSFSVITHKSQDWWLWRQPLIISFIFLSFRSDLKHSPCLTAAEATIRQGITKVVIKILKQDLLSDTPSKRLLFPRNSQLETKMLFNGHSHTIQLVAIPRYLSLFFNTRLSRILR